MACNCKKASSFFVLCVFSVTRILHLNISWTDLRIAAIVTEVLQSFKLSQYLALIVSDSYDCFDVRQFVVFVCFCCCISSYLRWFAFILIGHALMALRLSAFRLFSRFFSLLARSSRCVGRDFCKILAHIGSFWEWAIECCQLHFFPTDPRCHGDESWDKMGYNSACVRDFWKIFAGMCHRMVPIAFSPDWSQLPWQRNFGQNGL